MTAIMTAYTIEVCHPDETGRFTKKSYESLVQLTAWLCVKFRSDGDDVIRHYDVTARTVRNILWSMRTRGEDFRENVSLAITSEN